MATLRKDGRWVERKRTPQGRIVGYGSTEQEAQADLAEKLKALDQIQSLEPREWTLHDVAEGPWLARVVPREYSTRKRYISAYRNHIRDRLGLMPINSITGSIVQEWTNTQKRDDGGPCAPKTVRLHHEILSGIFKAAKMQGILTDEAPTTYTVLPKLPPKRKRALDVDKALEILEFTSSTPIAMPVYLSVTLGLRLGESAAIKWSDLDRTKRSLHVHKQRQAQKGAGVVEKPCKREQERTLFLLPEQIQAIDKYGDLDCEYICTYAGQPWVPNTIYEKWSEMRGELGLDEWSYHDLRHLAAGLLAAGGATLLQIAAVLGHKKIDTTWIYTELTENQAREGMSRSPIRSSSRGSR